MPTLKKIHSCNSHRPTLQAKIAREYFFHQPDEEFYFFLPLFGVLIFLPTHSRNKLTLTTTGQ
jgi:hypothetical protein